jgi:hypothetical protein
LLCESQLTSSTSSDKEVFPESDFLGWYSTASTEPGPIECGLHDQLVGHNELPLYAQFHGRDAEQKKDNRHQDVPYLTVYEPSTDSTTGLLRYTPVRVRMMAGEAERIAVEDVAKETPRGGEAGATAIAHLTATRTALDALLSRVKAIEHWGKQVESKKIPSDAALRRRVAKIAQLVPCATGNEFYEAFFKVILRLFLNMAVHCSYMLCTSLYGLT